MRLSAFITNNLEGILQAWEDFARRLVPQTEVMDRLALRDHAKEILQAVARDMETEQTPDEQFQKSIGLAAQESGEEESAAAIHGTLRHASHFSMYQLTAEYRALRATVLRLWLPHVSRQLTDVTDEMIRFNEAIDQALAESVVTFSARSRRAREMFLAILGHDLRAPLSVMLMAGGALERPDVSGERANELGRRVSRNTRLMNKMVADLIEYTRTQLGSGMPVSAGVANLRDTSLWALEDAQGMHPGRKFEFEAFGDLEGSYDEVRLHQLLMNLLVNAAQYGSPGTSVRLRVRGDAQNLEALVNNQGPVIASHHLATLFKPLVQLPSDEDSDRPSTSLGLGLYIAKEIAEAHGGDISATSEAALGTTFTLRIPRESQAQTE